MTSISTKRRWWILPISLSLLLSALMAYGDERIVFSVFKPTSNPKERPRTLLYCMKPDGTDVRELPNPGRDNYYPAVSPDGTKIAFCAQMVVGTNELGRPRVKFKLMIMNVNGSSLTELTDQYTLLNYPCFTSDGKKVIFDCRRTDGFDTIAIVDINGENLTELPGGFNGDKHPTIGAKGILVFAGVRKIDREQREGLYARMADGTHLLTGKHGGLYPMMHPTADTIVYQCLYQKEIRAALTSISQATPRIIPNTEGCYYPVFSPDGQRILYSVRSIDDPNCHFDTLISIRWDGTDKRRVQYTTDGMYFFGRAVWVPNLALK